MNTSKDFFDNHVSIVGMGFGSKPKDDKVAKDVKHTLKRGLTK